MSAVFFPHQGGRGFPASSHKIAQRDGVEMGMHPDNAAVALALWVRFMIVAVKEGKGHGKPFASSPL